MKLNLNSKEFLALYAFMRNHEGELLNNNDVHLNNVYGRINAYIISVLNSKDEDYKSNIEKSFQSWERSQNKKIGNLNSKIEEIKQEKVLLRDGKSILTPDDLPSGHFNDGDY